MAVQLTDDRDDKNLDLHPSQWDDDWQPPIGRDDSGVERGGIWQEFERDMHMRRSENEPVIGRGWPVLAIVLLTIGVLTWLEIGGGPEWLIAIRNLF